MLRFFVLLAGLLALACSSEPPPSAPVSAGKAVQMGLGGLLGTFEPAEDENLTTADSSFNIELIFEDGFPAWERMVIQDSKHHWEKQLNDIPDYMVKQGFYLSDYYVPAGKIIDDILIYVSTGARDFSTNNWGSIALEREGSGLPVAGEVQLVLTRWSYEDGYMDFPDSTRSQLEGPYHANTQSFIALHEMGHVLGIGMGKNWNDLVQEGAEYPNFTGEKAIEAYNALPRLVKVKYHPTILFGRDIPIVEQPGGILFKGDKVPMQGWGHWGATTGQELMSYGDINTPYYAFIYSYGLSTISVGALADIGYPVRHGFADPFWVTVDEEGNSIFPISSPSGKPSIFPENDLSVRCSVVFH